MTWARLISATRRHARDEAGASLIEYTVVISLFLLIFFAVLDFGRLGFNWVMTEKAMQRAARIATVRPPVCGGVPATHALDASSGGNFGSLCRSGACSPPAGSPHQCVLSAGALTCTNTPPSTAEEIWCTLQPILPSNATPQNIWLQYAYDPNLGFAGGPYTPMVQVAVATADNAAGGANAVANATQLRFEFITPIPGLAALVGGGATTSNIDVAGTGGAGLPSIPFPDLSVSLPGEDLNNGNNG